ncbi:M23 family metallopeptidase [Bacteroides uniformis]|uniref:M23 family peptidase n=2 Tax=Bacteroides uniformis TaxID=820 RepID=A0A414WCB1_BACUN|nr:M23 family metallopeptidase [Bacteroides uniformis]MCS2725140.1 M23 family metallopeptidase [Bacteroides uniformis]MDC1729985.1 M23 family metallopeptidase [Bacteroides uniformis]MDC1734482.1 M23 family metallopeptidase [Bacteroides uniformis]MDC1741356.1 M23 family metallopeptidase [Bacteroides uniformis]MDC1745217.1 M23 family metallopeptidase [Bacteroides uniformis]
MTVQNMKYSIFFSLLFFIGSVQSGYAQETDTDKPSFIPPFDFPITFSGNFGEIRANHFHGGLDFKTGGTIGKPVRALADGYISRIRVTHGSGYVLDVAYDNGYSTINRHLSAFVGDVARRVEDLQYEKESWEVEITPEPDEYPVKAGQIIALSGNTGYSFGPHLHLDMIETATDEYIDPLPFFMNKVKDKTAPRAEGIMLFPQPGKGVVEGKQTRRAFPAHPTKPITAWGLIGAGIRAYDYMDGVQNKYGVKTVILEVDGEEVFRSTVDRFAYEENRYINSWTHGQYMKSFIEPGNRLRMLQASNGNRGLVEINEERPYRFVYTLSDALGNTSKVRFTVQGQKTTIAPVEHREKYALKWDKVNYLQEPGLELVIPKGMLYDDVLLNYSVRADSGDIAFTYQLNDTRIPMHNACDLRIGLRRRPVEDVTKYYVAGVTARGGKYRIGGKYEDGVMKVRIRDLGTYTVAVDTVPPVITPVNQAQWGRTGKIIFKAKDKETGINTYRGTIDGKYALFGKPNSISGNLVCELDPKHVEKGGKHVVEMTVTDGCGNRTTEQFDFVW